jgi:DNA ligase (NAD+)
VLTPFAVLEPVVISGATISMATLHNEGDIRRKDIREGDTVIVQRAGEVIPQVVGPVLSLRTGGEHEFTMPEECPSCRTAVSRDPAEAAVYCPNPACPAQAIRMIEHFASRGAMDIEGLGERMAYSLFQSGLVRDVAEIYDLTAEKLMTLPGIKEKGADNLLRGIEASKGRPLVNVLLALGIRHVGWETARLVADHIGTLEGILEVTEEALQEIEGIGPVVAASIVAWAERTQNQDLVRRLVAHGVNPAQERTMARGGLLEGLTIVITGRLDTMSRNDAEDRIRELGGKVGSSVTRGTSYLVVGADAGSKAEKAEKLGTRLVTEDEFLRLIEGGAGGLDSASGA